jgi:hypothetical protein
MGQAQAPAPTTFAEYMGALRQCGKEGRATRAMELLSGMHDAGLRVPPVAFGCAVQAMCVAGRLAVRPARVQLRGTRQPSCVSVCLSSGVPALCVRLRSHLHGRVHAPSGRARPRPDRPRLDGRSRGPLLVLFGLLVAPLGEGDAVVGWQWRANQVRTHAHPGCYSTELMPRGARQS